MVKLRLARQGRKKLPIYKIVATDSRSRRDGRFLESLGQYRPSNEPGQKVQINEDRALYWLGVGAQPTDTVRSLLSSEGILLRWHLDKKKVEPARASEILTTWKAARDAKHATIVDAKMAAAHARDEAKRKAAAKKVADAAAAESAAIPEATYTPVIEQESAPVEAVAAVEPTPVAGAAAAVEPTPVAEAAAVVEPTPVAEAPAEAPQVVEEPAS